MINFHRLNKKLATITAVVPSARFGALKISGNKVLNFQEKPQSGEGWINGGFFVIEPKFFDLIKNDKTFLEKEPFSFATKKKQLLAYKHNGFWQCMDTKRDKDVLEKIYKNKLTWKNILIKKKSL